MIARRALIAAAALAFVAAPAASAAQRTPEVILRSYRILRAAGTLEVQFAGDGSATCQLAGRCGYRGTVDYTFSLDRDNDVPGDGAAFFVDHHFADLTGAFGVDSSVRTSVTQSDNTPACLDVVPREYESFDVTRRRDGRRGPLQVVFGQQTEIGEPAYDDHLASRCAGPTEADVSGGQGLLTGRTTLRALDHRIVRLTVTANRPFTAAGFTGTVTGSATFVLRRGSEHKLPDSAAGVFEETLSPRTDS